MKFTSFNLVLTSVLFAALTACGGGGGGDASQTNSSVQPITATNQLVPLANYAGATGTFQKVNLTMPAGGVLDLALQGTNVRIFDTAMNVVGQAMVTPWGGIRRLWSQEHMSLSLNTGAQMQRMQSLTPQLFWLLATYPSSETPLTLLAQILPLTTKLHSQLPRKSTSLAVGPVSPFSIPI